jgi:3-oxoadipate enol-lactonase
VNVLSQGIDIHAAIDGPAGAPWITFIAGIANDHTLWQPQITALSGQFRTMRLDARGHGASGSAPGPYSLAALAADVAAAWDAAGVERSCVVGLGLGGVVAAELALRHPARVSGLVPISCRARLTPAYQSIWPPMIELARKSGMPGVAEPTLARWFSEDFRRLHPATLDAIRRALLRTSLEGYLGCIAALLTLDWAGRLAELSMPVLYVSGQHDAVGAPPEIMQAMCEATPDARHVVLPDATHISVVCNPVAFNAALSNFVSAIG